MPLVSLSTTVFNASAHMILNVSEESSFGSINRRVARTKTLDGGAAIEDLGSNLGDTDWKLVVTGLNKSDTNTLRSMFENESMITVSCDYGVFTAAPLGFSDDQGEITLTLVINEKVS